MEEFFTRDVPAFLKDLKANTKPLWGRLTPQHMVEHLVSTWRISNGKAKVPLMIDPSEVDKRLAFLKSEKPFGKNIPNRLMGETLPPLRKPDLDSAKETLLREIRDFFQHYREHPEARYVHPFFGELDREGWLRFQKKHMTHHFIQFGLIDEPALSS